MTDEDRALIRRVVDAIIAGRVEELSADGVESRLTDSDVSDAVSEYGRTLVALPEEAFALAEVYDVEVPPTGRSVLVPMFTEEEGRSDLTLDVFVPDDPAAFRARIDDLHVL